MALGGGKRGKHLREYLKPIKGEERRGADDVEHSKWTTYRI